MATSQISTTANPSGLYHDLPESGAPIRLLTLLPPTVDDPDAIVCTLHVASLEADAPLEYESLSYAWGTGPDDQYITVNEQPFAIRENLMSALQHLRRKHGPRTLWIDAICINQTDLLERNQQVSQMYLVYAAAQRVLIWVGEKSSDSHMAMDLFRQARDDLKGWSEPPKDSILASRRQRRMSDEEYAITPAQRYASETALGNFFSRRWFRRVWVVQEAARARDIALICGHEELTNINLRDVWRRLFYAVEDFRLQMEVWAGVIFEPIYMIRKRFQENASLLDDTDFLQYLLEDFRDLFASDPRDHVFAIVGLARHKSSGNESPLIRIDYQRDVVELFTELTTTMMTSSQSLSILGLAGDEPGKDVKIKGEMPGLPSWVPDWSLSPAPHALTRNPFIQQDPYWACHNLRTRLGSQEAPWKINQNQLCTPALHIGDVVDTGLPQAFEVGDGMARCKKIFEDAKDVVKRNERMTASATPEDLIRTLAANRNRSRTRLVETIEPGITVFEAIDETVRKSINRNTVSRVFTVLTHGNMGLVPQKSEINDRVYVLPDCAVPVVLREIEALKDQTCKHYCFIGACYIHGIMEGEVDELYEQNVPSKWQWEDLVIV